MSVDDTHGADGVVRQSGSPWPKLLAYLTQYLVLWISAIPVLLAILGLNVGVAAKVGILRERFLPIAVLFLVLAAAIGGWGLVWDVRPEDTLGVLLRFYVVGVATFAAARYATVGELFEILETARIPRAVVFPFGIALSSLPLMLEEARILAKARGAWGHRRPRSFRGRLSHPFRLTGWLVVGALIRMLDRAEKVYLTIELRGLSDSLYRRPRTGRRSPLRGALFLAYAAAPVLGLVASKMQQN